MQSPKDAERATLAAHMKAFASTGGKIQKLERGASSAQAILPARKQNQRDIDKAIFRKKDRTEK